MLKEKYARALKFYLKAIKALKEKKDRNKEDETIVRKTFDSMFAALEKARLNKKRLSHWRVLTYTQYLSIYPGGKHSPSLYQRLFNIYYQRKDIKKCEEVLTSYVKHYPRRNDKKAIINNSHHEKQQFMLTKLLNHIIAVKESSRLAYWIKTLEGGYLEFDSAYLEKISRIRSDIIFENLNQKKNAKQLISKLEKAYNNEEYSTLVRSKAAYYLGENLIGTLSIVDSLPWFQRALALVGPRDRPGFQEGDTESCA